VGRGFEPHGAHVTSLAEIHQSGDYLTHEKLWIASLKSGSFAYRNGYFLTTPGRWRGFDWSNILEHPPTQNTLVIGHSDNGISAETVAAIMSSSNVRHILATNIEANASTISGVADLPLGIPNEEKQSRTHIIQSDAGLLRKAWQKGRPPRSPTSVVLYANFSIRNNPPERSAAWSAMENEPGTHRGRFELSRRGRLRDLTAMRNSGLVVCPPGGGMDTHRFWEALLVGAIPVTTHNDHSARLARTLDLPVITVTSWQELKSRKFLLEEWQRVSEAVWDFSPLTSQFWLNQIYSRVLPVR
jgi:hypothetical protein